MLTINPNKLIKIKQIDKLEQIGQYFYKKKDIIGQGFSSKVYSGINKINQKQVAIKVINTQILTQKIHITLLQSQLQTLQILKGCSNILQMYQFVKIQNQTYIISQYCQTDLSKKILPLLSLDIIIKYLYQLIQGYCQLFHKQIIHRDLKPTNLLIHIDQHNCHNHILKIADFGFAIKLNDARLQTKFNIGSPLYMSPEVLKKNQYSYKSDIWSIGVIVFQMLTGDTPWHAQTQQKLYQKLQQNKIQQILSQHNFPQNFNEFLKKTLQFDKKKRISPQQLFLLQICNQSKQQIQQSSQNINQSLQNKSQQLPDIIQNQKKHIEKQKKIYKSSSNNSPTYNKTYNSPENIQYQIAINIKPSTKIKKISSNTVDQNNTHLHIDKLIIDLKQGTTTSTAKTNQSNTMIANQDTLSQLPKLDKISIKTITKNLIYYIHSCRLLYKIIIRINQVIIDNFNQLVITKLSQIKQQIFKQYCKIIMLYMYKVKNFSNNNFINLINTHHQQYINGTQYKKVKKVCCDYIDRYSKSNQLRYYWTLRQQPNITNCIKLTKDIITMVWPQLCQKNHNQIILLQFLILSHQILQALDKGSYNYVTNKTKIQDYVDTIPNPPNYNRFKSSISDAKKICQHFNLSNIHNFAII